MIEIKITCDYCSDSLKKNAYNSDFFIEVNSQIKRNIADDLRKRDKDPIPLTLHFCNLDCLRGHFQ